MTKIKLLLLIAAPHLFILTATPLRAAPEAIVPGQTESCSISARGQTNFYTFSAVSNSVIYLTVLKTNGPGNYPYLYLYDPDGEVITAGTGNALLTQAPNLRLNKTGLYTVAVLDDGSYESFDYTICVITIPGPNFPDPGEGAD